MNKNFLFYLVLLLSYFNSLYGMEFKHLETPTTEQTVSTRIQETRKYSEFARKQCSEETAHPKLWISSNEYFRTMWNYIADCFDDALEKYNGNDLRKGDFNLDLGLGTGITVTYRSILFWKQPNTSVQKIIDEIISSLEDIEGSPIYYPRAIENWRNWSNEVA
ncbi:MAG: hypothetical protein IJ730_02735 [Alphaproteobacteria bacterium]|nr:hypothetical protein [Alphaproteobacteria bacterium]